MFCFVLLALHFVFLLGLERNIWIVISGLVLVLMVLLLKHLALLIVRSDLDILVGGRLAAAARAHPAEEDAEAVASFRREGEVENRVQKRGGVDGPLHNGLVGFVERQEGVQVDVGEVAGGEDVVDVEELEGGPGGLPDEDEEEGDQRQPELGRPELAGAAGADLGWEINFSF